MNYWRRVVRRAWQETRKTSKLETTEAIVMLFAGQAVIAALLWYCTGDANLRTRVATIAASILPIPVVFACKFVASLKLLDAEAEEKVETLHAQVEQRARKMAVKDALGVLIETGTDLLRQTWEIDVDVKPATGQWASRCRDLIKAAFGSGEVSLFLNDSSYTFYVSYNHSPVTPFIKGRLRHLGELMHRADTMDLSPNFDPQSWAHESE